MKFLLKWAMNKYLTAENITRWIVDGVNKLLARIKNGETLDRVCEILTSIVNVLNAIVLAIKDRNITDEEAENIKSVTKQAIDKCVSADTIAALKKKISDSI